MNSADFHDLVARRAKLAADIKEATEERKFLDHQITEHLEDTSLRALDIDGYRVSLVARTTRRLDKKLLLAKGVTPTIIAACETESTSESVRVTPRKES